MATLENPFPIMKAMCWLPKWFASFPGLGLRVWGFGFSDSGLQGGACYNPKPHASKKEVLTILALLPRALKTRSSGTKNEALDCVPMCISGPDVDFATNVADCARSPESPEKRGVRGFTQAQQI